MTSLPEFTISKQDIDTTISFSGRFDSRSVSALLVKIKREISFCKTPKLIFDFAKLEYLDTAGAVFICHLEQFSKQQGFNDILIRNLKQDDVSLVKLAKSVHSKSITDPSNMQLSFIGRQGKKVSGFLSETKEFITYIGEITWALIMSLLHPKSIRWADTFIITERSGVDALPIVALISFIVGLVMAFQAALPMKMFGAELYVANLIGISMVRELGPLMTAIVLAGRSSSAFAAEIGTMRINEEIDALTVMGIDPIRFLIVPRIIAATFFTPLLTIFANLMGILGGALVVTSFGYPIIAYYNQVSSFVSWIDFSGGMVKCFVFGIVIAATGCIRGYQAGSGPSAVGVATTKAVVSSIVIIALFDGVFSIMFYYIGI